MKRHASKVRESRAPLFEFLFPRTTQAAARSGKMPREAAEFRPSFEALEVRTLMAVDMTGGAGDISLQTMAGGGGHTALEFFSRKPRE